jgi:hypothetical protein
MCALQCQGGRPESRSVQAPPETRHPGSLLSVWWSPSCGAPKELAPCAMRLSSCAATECVRAACRIVRPFRAVAPHLIEQSLPPLLTRFLSRRCGLWGCWLGGPTRGRRQSAPNCLLDIEAGNAGWVARNRRHVQGIADRRILATRDEIVDLGQRACAEAGEHRNNLEEFGGQICLLIRAESDAVFSSGGLIMVVMR